jgi:GNAT superfamily N-acetyltransferase/predicted nucleic acid-binding protein
MAVQGPMISIVAIDDRSPNLEEVKKLWRVNSGTLGFLPEGAFNDYARKRHILVALDSASTCAGYLLYRIVRDKATIAHLCISEDARGKGYGAALVNHLINITGHLRGISLRCRRDFPAYTLWQRLGFVALNEVPGRGKEGSSVTQFWLDYNNRDLLTEEATTKLLVAIDTNIFIDLIESRSEESLGLQADWLQDSITLAVTEESYNEIDRSGDPALRRRRKSEIAAFSLLRSSPKEYQNAEQVIAPLFPDLSTEQDKSDLRQLVRALAAGADLFVTRDEELLQRSDGVYKACGLSVVRPAELIGQVDELLREHEYQHAQVAGTNRIVRKRINVADDMLIEAIRHPNEPKRHLVATVNRLFADPTRFTCVTIRDRAEGLLAFYATKREGLVDWVPLLRTCSHRLAGTLARSILMELISRAARDGHSAVVVAEPCAVDDVRTALADIGFLSTQSGWVKLVVPGVLPASQLADRVDSLGMNDPTIAQLASMLRSSLDPTTASQVEHLLFPGKIADIEVPSFIVPIQPDYALHLFDENLAKQRLYGADIELALNPESVYYRSARQRLPQYPGRVLWYVSQNGKFQGTMTIRACSRIAEVCIDKPKSLFKRFRRLGVYEWSDLLKTAKGNIEKEILAVRFHDTEPLKPVGWDAFQAILKKHGTKTNLESPVRISREEFNEIYALGLGSSAIR